MKPSIQLEIWRAPDVIGFATHWIWIECVFWSSLFYTTANVSALGNPLSPLEPLWAVSLLSNVLSIAAILIFARHWNPLAAIRWLPWLGAALTAVGTLLMCRVVALLVGDVASMLYMVGSVITGVGSGIIVVLWGEAFAETGSRQTVVYSVLALLIAAAAYVVIILLPIEVAQLIVSVMPIVNIVLFLNFRQSLHRTPRKARNIHVREKVPLHMVAIAFFFGLSFGIMKGFAAPMDSGLIALRDNLNIVAIIIGAVAVYVTMTVYKMDFDHLTYQIALPLMAAGFLFMPLSGPLSVAGTAIHMCGYQYFYIVLWAIWAVIAQEGKIPAGWAAAWGMLAIQAGQLVGSFSAAEASIVVVDGFGRAMVSALIIFLILIIALFAFGNRSANTGWGYIKPNDVPSATSGYDDAATRIARRFKLSPRETDVLFLLSHGRNRAYISEELIIGDETVKSHIKNIYTKMGVHSQQEVIDLVEHELGGTSTDERR